MAARIILVLLLILVVLGGIGETFSSINDQMTEIEELVRLAVEDDSWIFVSSKEELTDMFLRTFSSELTEQLVEDSWVYFENPTGFLQQAQLVKTKTMVLSQTAYTIAHLELFDLSKKESQLVAKGTALFYLSNKTGQWKITQMEYKWDYLD